MPRFILLLSALFLGALHAVNGAPAAGQGADWDDTGALRALVDALPADTTLATASAEQIVDAVNTVIVEKRPADPGFWTARLALLVSIALDRLHRPKVADAVTEKLLMLLPADSRATARSTVASSRTDPAPEELAAVDAVVPPPPPTATPITPDIVFVVSPAG